MISSGQPSTSLPVDPYVYLRLSIWSHRFPPHHQKTLSGGRAGCSACRSQILDSFWPPLLKLEMAHYAQPGLLARPSKLVLFIHREWLRSIKPGNFSQDYLFAQYLSSEAQTSLGSAQESGNFYRCRVSMRRPLTDIPRQGIRRKFSLTHLAMSHSAIAGPQIFRNESCDVGQTSATPPRCPRPQGTQ